MRRRLVFLLVLLNLVLGATLLSAPAGTQIIPLGIWNCCKSESTEAGGGFCCERCCWLTSNCNFDEDCQGIERD